MSNSDVKWESWPMRRRPLPVPSPYNAATGGVTAGTRRRNKPAPAPKSDDTGGDTAHGHPGAPYAAAEPCEPSGTGCDHCGKPEDLYTTTAGDFCKVCIASLGIEA